MARTTGVNQKQIAKILRECVFSPAKPGPMKVVSDVGDPRYYQTRVIELLTQERGRCMNVECVKTLRTCIQLLSLSIGELQHGNIIQSSETRSILDPSLER